MKKEEMTKNLEAHIKTTKGVTRSKIVGKRENAWKELEVFRMMVELNKG